MNTEKPQSAPPNRFSLHISIGIGLGIIITLTIFILNEKSAGEYIALSHSPNNVHIMAYYDNAWSKLIIAGSIFGLAVPLLVHIYQNYLAQLQLKNIDDQIKRGTDELHGQVKFYKDKLEVATSQLEKLKYEVTDVRSKLELASGQLNTFNEVITDVQNKLGLANSQLDKFKNEMLGIRSEVEIMDDLVKNSRGLLILYHDSVKIKQSLESYQCDLVNKEEISDYLNYRPFYRDVSESLYTIIESISNPTKPESKTAIADMEALLQIRIIQLRNSYANAYKTTIAKNILNELTARALFITLDIYDAALRSKPSGIWISEFENSIRDSIALVSSDSHLHYRLMHLFDSINKKHHK